MNIITSSFAYQRLFCIRLSLLSIATLQAIFFIVHRFH